MEQEIIPRIRTALKLVAEIEAPDLGSKATGH